MKSSQIDRRLLLVFFAVVGFGVIGAAPPPGFGPVGDTGLAVADVETLATSSDMALQKQRLYFDGDEAVAYRIRVKKSKATMKVLASDKVVRLEKLFEKPAGNFVAINGGFYDTKLQPMGLVVSGGKVQNEYSKQGGSGIVESRDKAISVVHRSKYQKGADEALQSIDRIVSKGKSLVRQRSEAPPAARSVVAVGEEYLWLIVVVAHSSIHSDEGTIQLRSTSRGLPLWATARYLIETTDVVDALNLDGGVSTQLIARVGEERLEIRGVSGTINGILAK